MKVTVFTTGPGCGNCTATKAHLKKKKIEFTEVRMDQDPNLVEDFKKRGFLSAPVVQVEYPDGMATAWDGYWSTKIDALAA